MLWYKARSWGGLSRKVSKALGEHLPGCDCSWPPQQHGWPCSMRPHLSVVLTSLPSPYLLASSPSASTHCTQAKACCSRQGCAWAQWESHSCRLRDRSWSLWASAAKMIFLLHVCIMPTVRRFDYGLQMWDTTVKLVWMEKDKHAIAMETKQQKKITIIGKIFAITKEYLVCTHQSHLWQALKDKRIWEKEKKREKSRGEARSGGEERDWDSGYF